MKERPVVSNNQRLAKAKLAEKECLARLHRIMAERSWGPSAYWAGAKAYDNARCAHVVAKYELAEAKYAVEDAK